MTMTVRSVRQKLVLLSFCTFNKLCGFSLVCVFEECVNNMFLLLLTLAVAVPFGEPKNITGQYPIDDFIKSTPSCLPSECSDEGLAFLAVGSVTLSLFFAYLVYCCLKAYKKAKRCSADSVKQNSVESVKNCSTN